MYFVAGNSIKSVINVSKNQIKLNKKPIINFIKEYSNNDLETFNEYINLYSHLDKKYSIALKLSSLNFNEKLITDLVNLYKKKQIKIFIDAENSKNNYKYQKISNNLILKHNKNNCNIIKTYQMYRKDSYDQITTDNRLFTDNKIKFGAKIVRGAYWNTENKNGELFVCKKETDNSYNKIIDYLDNIDCYTILATHNDESIDLGISKKSNFKYAHLLDMNTKKYEKIKKNNEVFVYIPYGPYISMIPYLTRRLYENIDMIKYMFK